MTVEDSYAVQAEWRRRGEAEGRRVVGHKIGLTSKPMQRGNRHHRTRLRDDLLRPGL